MPTTLGQMAVGSIVTLNENGSPVNFYVAKHDYESDLNGSGRTLVVRRDVYDLREWNNVNVNAYASSSLDSWFNSTYKNMLDAVIRSLIGTTKIRYTPGNGNITVGTLERAIFALSLTELGQSDTYANTEGSALPIASTLRIAYRNGSATTQWTRSPYTYYARTSWRLYSNGGINNTSCYDSCGSRPAFTLPSTLVLSPDGTLPTSPTFNQVPSQAMENQPIPLSWSTLNGATSYTLQRSADSGQWTTVYTGPNTSYTDTTGSWTTVQYQVAATVGGVLGVYGQSAVIPVISAAVLSISGEDGNLGTITSNISYTVTSNTGNPISLTRTVNGAQVVTLTVNSGFAYNIPIADLPTGTGTIVITASVEDSSKKIQTATRTWTYYKTPINIPSTGGIAQLTQNGQNIWPVTVPDAVQAPVYLGGNLNAALNKLGQAALYTKIGSPKYNEVTVDLSKVNVGDEVLLPENGVMVPFYVGSLNYEPTLNTSGNRVLLIRKENYKEGKWNNTNVNTYLNSVMDNWFNDSYLYLLDNTIQSQIGTTTFYYTPGNNNNTITTLTKAIFALSLTELGLSHPQANVEGSSLAIATKLNISYSGGIPKTQWTRSPRIPSTTHGWFVTADGVANDNFCGDSYGYRPCFTLPITFNHTYYVDSNNNVYPSQEYTTGGSITDVFGYDVPICQHEAGSYVGTGTYGENSPNTLTFSFNPKLIIIMKSGNYNVPYKPKFCGNDQAFFEWVVFIAGISFVFTDIFPSRAYKLDIAWDENKVSYYNTWSSASQLNESSITYHYVAIG